MDFNIASLDLFSEPPPLAATVISTLLPGNEFVVNHGRVLSLVFLRPKAGSAKTEARSTFEFSR